MKFTPEQLTKAKAAKSVEELLTLAKENSMELTEEEAKKFFAELNKEGELADDELSNVSGGGCFGGRPDPVKIESSGGGQAICPSCGGLVTRWKDQVGVGEDAYELHGCTECGRQFRRYYSGDEWTED